MLKIDLTEVRSRRPRRTLILFGMIAASALSGCATLPASGPTNDTVAKTAKSTKNVMNFELVDITPQSLPSANDARALDENLLGMLANFTTIERSDTIRPGDTLAIAIYEVGFKLFGSGSIVPGADIADFATANAQTLRAQIDPDGFLTLPYLGKIRAAGLNPAGLSQRITEQLRPFSQSPQVMVTITDTLEGNAILSGSIARSGRYRLTSAQERLLDLVAIAGGPTGNASDIGLRIVRGTRVATIRLSDLRPEGQGNIIVAPGDRIELIREPRSYTVFGATEKVSQIPFETNELTLAEAISRTSGPSDNRADARGVFLFRFEQSPEGENTRPVAYRLNMLDPNSYFLAQKIVMQDKDVILYSASPSNLTSKFINMLNQLASPIVTGVVVSR